MKKMIKSALGLLCCVCLFTACSDDNDANPVIQTPTQFVVNTPAMAEQYIQLSQSNKVILSWSQPDYGFNAKAVYKVQVGLVENGTIKWNEENGQPKYLETPFTSCNVNISGEEIATAICELDGITSETIDNYVDKGFREIAMRVRASYVTETPEKEIPGTEIVSNIVTFKHMAAYCAVKSPGIIYLVGNCTGWTEPSEKNAGHYASWRVVETAIGSNVFVGTFEMPAGDLQFRFYTKLTGWEDDSMGPQVDDAGVESEFTEGVFEGDIDAGKGTWLFHNFPGGNLKVTVDMTQKKVKFELVGFYFM